MSRPIAAGFTVYMAEHTTFDTPTERKRPRRYHIKYLPKVSTLRPPALILEITEAKVQLTCEVASKEEETTNEEHRLA